MTSTETSTRTAGAVGLISSIVAAAGAATIYATTDHSVDLVRGGQSAASFWLTEPVWVVTHLLALLSILGLRRSGLTGDSGPARAGMLATLAGLALLVPAEAVVPFIGGQSDSGTAMSIVGPIFGLASMLATIGLLTLGVTTLRARRWSGWARFTPLLAGLCGVLLTGLGPTDAFLLGIAIWKLSMAAVGLAMYRSPSGRSAASTATAADPTARSGHLAASTPQG